MIAALITKIDKRQAVTFPTLGEFTSILRTFLYLRKLVVKESFECLIHCELNIAISHD